MPTLRLKAGLSRVARSRWLHPLNDRVAWNRALARLQPLWSLDEIRARIVGRDDLDADTFSLWLQPNRHWRGHLPGQHVLLTVEIDGVRRQRAFSISSAGGRRDPLRLTIRRQSGGGVTEWLHRHAGRGQQVSLAPASGNFVLPASLPGPLLMLAAGSGITPLLAMLHGLANAGHRGPIDLLQLSRTNADRLFTDEIERLREQLPGLVLHHHASTTHGRFDPTQLPAMFPDLATRTTLMCGPAVWMDHVRDVFSSHGLEHALRQESFGRPRPAATGRACVVDCSESAQSFTQAPGRSLLEAAEAAGLQPPHGCRAGLCRSCLCHKRSGRVRNLLTGASSAEPDEWIQLCISVAESELELAL